MEAGHAGGVELHSDRDARIQVGVAVIADRDGPVDVDGCDVMF